jgi:hypothetical protein
MLIFWRIRYLDRHDRQFKDRDLYLLTTSLDVATKTAVELLMEIKSRRTERDIFKFRHLFQTRKDESLEDLMDGQKEFKTVSLTEYFEDENCNELSGNEVGQILTGSPTVIHVPNGAESHDIEYMLSVPAPLPVANVGLNTDQVKLFGYFCRDLKELLDSEFMKEEHSAQLHFGGNSSAGKPVLETAVTDDEIRSFVTIFRRLYMTTEQADFLKAAKEFANALGNHPKAKWVQGVADSYKAKMDKQPALCFGQFNFNLTRQRLLDVFIYTQYAHQPDDKKKKPSQQRERQFNECLQEVGGKHSVLSWLFLSELSNAGSEIKCAGRVIAGWFHQYCLHHNLTPQVLNSLLDVHPGIGAIEKAEQKRSRLLGEKTHELAEELWRQNGSPPMGPVQFLHQAHEQLSKVLQFGQTASESSDYVEHP